MKIVTPLIAEWKHFVRSPFKIVSVLLFVGASLYGLQNGSKLYFKQQSEISRIEKKVTEERQKVIGYFNDGKLIPEERPWIDYSAPFWSIWFSYVYHFKNPSPAMVYSTGQSEQYGYYKRVTFWASPYDSDLVEEIANPERLQIGTLDFSFALLYLLPLVFLILVYNIKSAESEEGFLPLVEVQTTNQSAWILARMSFYLILLASLLAVLLLVGASLTNLLATTASSFSSTLFLSYSYLMIWFIIYFFILRQSKSILSNTLKMVGVYLLLTFIIPGAVHQYVSIKLPANLMTDFIDVRDEQQELYNQPDSVFRTQLFELFPDLKKSPVYQDSIKMKAAVSESTSSLINELKKNSLQPIEVENQARRDLIHSTFWYNPVSFFQNELNQVSMTHFDNYQAYRNELQALIDQQIQLMVYEVWEDRKVDLEQYKVYYQELKGDG